jgi:hypothetical protein
VKIKVWSESADLVDEITEIKPAGTQISALNIGRYAPGVYFFEVAIQYDSGGSDKTGILKFTVLR